MQTWQVGVLLVAVEFVVLTAFDWTAAAVWLTVIGLAGVLYLMQEDQTLLPAAGKAVLITGCDSGTHFKYKK